jgi:hypothetical protein
MESCVYCNRTSEQIPLLLVRSQGQDYWICPQHLPVLIHKPEQLANLLPGAGQLGTPEGH